MSGRRATVRRTLLGAAAVLTLAGCASAGGAGMGGSGRSRGPLSREDRVVLTQFTNVTSVAVGRRLVYAASEHGLAIYDRQFDDWLPPFTRAAGFPHARVSVMAADPATDGVWIGGFGEVLYYRPDIDLLQRVLVPGQVDVIMFDSRNYAGGAFVRSAGQWTRVSETGFASPVQSSRELPPPNARVVPPSLAQLHQEFPSLRAFERMLTRDEGSMRSWPVTSGARAPDVTEVWLGTWGNGVFQVDPLFQRSTHRPFGLLDASAGAIALAADGVWIAGGGGTATGRAGLVFASTSLDEWRWIEHPVRTPLLGARAFDLETRGARAWMATDRGVARLDTRSENDLRFWTGTNGLPSDFAYAVAPRDDGAWVGTARGLVFVTDSGLRAGQARAGDVSDPIVSGVGVRALLLTGDTLWIGTDAGLLLLPPTDVPGTGAPVRPSAAEGEPRLRQSIRALARSDSLVLIATRDELLRMDLRSGRLLPRMLAPDLARIGGIEGVAIDARTIWLVGSRGALVVARDTELSRFVSVGNELPGTPTDVVLTDEYAWISTADGVVRLRLRADGMPQ